MEPEEIVKIAVAALENKKAEKTRVIDIHSISTLADYFIITNGTNQNQIQAMADQVTEDLGMKGCLPKHIEGKSTSNWLLIDYGDVVIHIFDRESRSFYNLEHIWKDGEEYSFNASEKNVSGDEINMSDDEINVPDDEKNVSDDE